ncbi:type IV pilus modification PilV family protein [Craterilacuibacter sp.]|uniref:type IV pilus modification PilV family protein n=1 Tax=Craterilacuibacter sp. TaxID=2870909 RepID=UPI003F317CC8
MTERGLSLIEVLVALVISMLGMLGIAGLLLSNLKNGGNSYWRTQAAMLSEEVTERIRINSYWPDQGTSAVLPDYSIECSSIASMPLPCTVNGSGTLCSGSTDDTKINNARKLDQYQLCQKVGDVALGGLPGGKLKIERKDSSDPSYGASLGSHYLVTLSWKIRSQRNALPEQFQYQTRFKP